MQLNNQSYSHLYIGIFINLSILDQKYICLNILESTKKKRLVCIPPPIALSKTLDHVTCSYECDCTETGFTGDYCEEDILECASDPCQHGATCLEGIREYKCLCWPGRKGFFFSGS